MQSEKRLSNKHLNPHSKTLVQSKSLSDLAACFLQVLPGSVRGGWRFAIRKVTRVVYSGLFDS